MKKIRAYSWQIFLAMSTILTYENIKDNIVIFTILWILFLLLTIYNFTGEIDNWIKN